MLEVEASEVIVYPDKMSELHQLDAEELVFYTAPITNEILADAHEGWFNGHNMGQTTIGGMIRAQRITDILGNRAYDAAFGADKDARTAEDA